MKSDDLLPRIDRRTLVSGLALLPAAGSLLSTPVRAQNASSAPLASWTDCPAKQAIIDFVRATTDQSSPKLVAAEDRIVCSDLDGTLWVERPIYTQVVYCLDRVPAVVTQKPELKNREPFKTVMSGDKAAIAALSLPALEEILAATLAGMDTFEADVAKWLGTAKCPRWDPLYTDLTYQPMQEVLQFMRDSGDDIGLVTAAVVRILSASIRNGSMASRRSRWSEQWAGQSLATLKTASRS